MRFKFLSDNNDDKIPITMNDIVHAISLGREHYLNGHSWEDNPYHTPELYEAFNEGWELEEGYAILREARASANNGTI